jgi:hypothetical protein
MLNPNGIGWANYFQDVPQVGSFLPFNQSFTHLHSLPLATFLSQAVGAAEAQPLPQVSFLDPNFGLVIRARKTMNVLRPSAVKHLFLKHSPLFGVAHIGVFGYLYYV